MEGKIITFLAEIELLDLLKLDFTSAKNGAKVRNNPHSSAISFAVTCDHKPHFKIHILKGIKEYSE